MKLKESLSQYCRIIKQQVFHTFWRFKKSITILYLVNPLALKIILCFGIFLNSIVKFADFYIDSDIW